MPNCLYDIYITDAPATYPDNGIASLPGRPSSKTGRAWKFLEKMGQVGLDLRISALAGFYWTSLSVLCTPVILALLLLLLLIINCIHLTQPDDSSADHWSVHLTTGQSVCGLLVEYRICTTQVAGLIPTLGGPIQPTSKLITYCVLRSTQPPSLSGTVNE